MRWNMTVLAWLLVLSAPAPFHARCDRLKAFYNRQAWPVELCDGCRAPMPGPHAEAFCKVETTTPSGQRSLPSPLV